jgi:hypothetical protein
MGRDVVKKLCKNLQRSHHRIRWQDGASCVGLARTVYICTVYDHMFGVIPAKNIIYICTINFGSGQP